MQDVKRSFKAYVIKTWAYTDSMVVLHWVRSHKILHDAVVRRRVNKITKIFRPEELHHVPTDENPADAASRGMDPNKFLDYNLWFEGPKWLRLESLPTTELPDQKPRSPVTHLCEVEEPEMITWFSKYQRMLRILTVCRRWKTRQRGPLSCEEIEETKQIICRVTQKRFLGSELTAHGLILEGVYKIELDTKTEYGGF
jgi:hypothetical protein